MRNTCRLLTTSLIPIAVAGSAVAQSDISQIALSGEAAPGAVDGAIFGGFSNVVLNDAGQVAFVSFLETGTGAPVTSDNSTALFAPTLTSDLEIVARKGDVAPGVADGAVYSSFQNTAYLSDSGEVAFEAVLATGAGPAVTGVNDGAIFGPNGGLGLIAREGAPAPGTADNAVFADFDEIDFSAAGDFLLQVELATGTGAAVTSANDQALLGPTAGPGSALGVIARRGDPAPGVADGAAYLGFSNRNTINNQGEVAFAHSLQTGTGTVVDDDNNSAVFGPSGSGLGLLGREDSPAPGVSDGAEFSGFGGAPVLNNAGDTAFVGFLRTGNGDPVEDSGPDSNNSALFGPTSGSGSSLGLVARANDPAPGTADDAEFDSFNAVRLNDHGDLLFTASVRTGTGAPVDDSFSGPDSNNFAIFGPTDGPGSALGVIARRGDTAPGVTDGAELNFFATPQFNNAGQAAFISFLRDGTGGGAVDSTNGTGLFAYADGELSLIARAGDLFTVLLADGITEEQRTISFISFGSTVDNGTPALNNEGQLAFTLSFTDGSGGIFVATIPEPTTLALLGMSGLTLATRRRK
ncbi:PEP-CTERM sorting domain-containing protein [Algisphaera agarilytica]|uniref:PEP-CTERM protein-sorting domain-containing protein n=1 Tax=Algisphaera agarilytica TaxID=1385975 RepID=A0A7X0LJP8_9BACT|nr:PEP-CTERM sorting domain-containing protein [Algisphaera agarilytica]MBB6428984.1 hypothetical protein [Algisphaera agarilytica]